MHSLVVRLLWEQNVGGSNPLAPTTSHGYNRLWKLLIDRGMTRTQMRLAAGISTSTLAKLSKGEDVNSSILVKICDALQCNIGDIADCVHNAKKQTLGAGA